MSFELELVRPIAAHAELIFLWRNDPVTRMNSFHTVEKNWGEFLSEFQGYFRFPDLPPVFAIRENKPIAFLHFNPVEDFAHEATKEKRRCCSLSINVAPVYRGGGVGSALLEAIKPWIREQGYDALYGEVKIENTVSRKAFLKAGYRELPAGIKIVETDEIPIVRYVADLQPHKENLKPVFIIAEAGSNWRMGNYKNDLFMAKRMIALAAEAKADAVKFQVFRPETIYVKNAGSIELNGVEESMQDLFSEIMMPYEMIAELHEECRKHSISFMATPFSPDDFAAVDPFVEYHKIASYELNYPRLLSLAAKSHKPLFLSTGASTEEEIAWAVKYFHSQGGHDLTLLQCTACYPAPPSSMNIGILPWLQRRFQVPVGLSDHSENPFIAAVMAVTLGAKVIEKHFTIDKLLPGPDHSFAITPKELKELVVAVRQAEEMKGGYVKEIDPSEMELRYFARRGIQSIKEMPCGTLIKEGENVAILRPGRQAQGMHPKFLSRMEGKRTTRDISSGEGLRVGDFK